MLYPDYQYNPLLVTPISTMIAYGIYDAALGPRILGGGALRGKEAARAGDVWQWGDLRKMGILLTYVGSIALTHLLVVAEARYSIPVLAFLAIPAGVAAASSWDKIRTDTRFV